MHPKDIDVDRLWTVHIDGSEQKGIPDFDWEDRGEIHRYFRSQPWTTEDGITIKVKVKWNTMIFAQLTGLWDWIVENCPNRRVVHFMRYGKNDRVKKKNFYRALEIMGRELRKYG